MPVGEQVEAVHAVHGSDLPGAVGDLCDLAEQDARMPDDPAGERAVPGLRSGEHAEAVAGMRAAQYPVDADLACRCDGLQLILLAHRDDLEHDLKIVSLRAFADLAKLGRARPDVLESHVPQPAVADRLVDLQRPVDRAVVVRQHENELDHWGSRVLAGGAGLVAGSRPARLSMT